MLRKDIMTVSRFMRELKAIGIDSNIDFSNTSQMLLMMYEKIKPENLANIVSVISDIDTADNVLMFEEFNSYLLYIAVEDRKYQDEIELRKNHSKNLGIYREETPEEMQVKIDKNKDIYRADYHLAMYKILCKNGINPEQLTLYETFILCEDISCEEIKNSTYQLLGLIESEDKNRASTVESYKNVLKNANFYNFALDIHESVDELYQSIVRKRK